MGSVRQVILNADAYYACLTHAFSNEQEEIMGLCIGEAKDTILGCEVHVTSTLSLRRLDKRKDRVEISVEQLSNASTKVEELAQRTGKPLRIVGWYHSHPHITVWPSHVDIATQADYQMMDNTFIGLIFSCFNDSKINEHSVHLTCFQSIQTTGWDSATQDSVEIPITILPQRTIDPSCIDALKELPGILLHEENDTYEATYNTSTSDFMTSLHNGSVYVQALCKLNSTLLLPMLQVTERSSVSAQHKLKETEKVNEKLKRMITELIKADMGET